MKELEMAYTRRALDGIRNAIYMTECALKERGVEVKEDDEALWALNKAKDILQYRLIEGKK